MVIIAVYWPVCIFCKGEPVKRGEQTWSYQPLTYLSTGFTTKTFTLLISCPALIPTKFY